MNALATLLQRHPLVFFHLTMAVAALLLGALILSRRKGTRSHRGLGWAWVLLMAATALSSAFIRGYKLPNLYGYSPVHALTLFVAVMLPLAVWQARRGNVRGHRRTMQGLFIGGCVIAGLFTLLPGRFLGNLLWCTPLSGMAS